MGRRSRVALVAASLAASGLGACGLDTTGEGPADAGVDVTGIDMTVGDDTGSPPEDAARDGHHPKDGGGHPDVKFADVTFHDSPGDDGSDGGDTGMDAGHDAEDTGADAHDGGTDAGDASDSGRDSAADTGTEASMDSGLTYACGSGAVDDCSACSGDPVGCVFCKPTKTIGFCIPEGAVCLTDSPGMGYSPCGCTDSSNCVTDEQICAPVINVCMTCGEVGTDMATCKNGKKCDQASATCK